jgi:hypothetical protein
VTLDAPGQFVEIDAHESSFATCSGGTLQFRYSAVGGVVLRDWSEDPVHVVAPQAPLVLAIEARCTSGILPDGSLELPDCGAVKLLEIEVPCPVPSGAAHGAFAPAWPGNDPILALSRTRFGWTTSRAYQVFAGDLALVATYTGGIVASSPPGTSFDDTATPSAGAGTFYVLRQGEFCNAAGPWTTTGAFAGSGECGAGANPACPGGTHVGRDKTDPPVAGAVGLPF